MNVQPVSTITVQYADPDINSDKFYRTYTVGTHAVFQWGRRGALGQFKVVASGSGSAAEADCRKQIRTKERKGYDGHQESEFDFDLDKFDPKNPSLVAHAYEAAHLDQFDNALAGISGKAPATVDAVAVLAERALKAISLSVEQPARAFEEYALIQHEFTEVQESFARASSYLNTLEQLVREGAA